MYLITTYGNWNYECYAYDLDSIPDFNWQTALKTIIESGEEIWAMHEGLLGNKEDSAAHKPPDKVFVWDVLRWVEIEEED